MQRATRVAAFQRKSSQPVSAARDGWYERPRAVGLLLEGFFDFRIKLATVCPETALMYAVLEDAFLCIHGQFKTERFMRRASEAEDWFFSDDFRGFFLSCPSAMRLGWSRTTYGQNLNIGGDKASTA